MLKTLSVPPNVTLRLLACGFGSPCSMRKVTKVCSRDLNCQKRSSILCISSKRDCSRCCPSLCSSYWRLVAWPTLSQCPKPPREGSSPTEPSSPGASKPTTANPTPKPQASFCPAHGARLRGLRALSRPGRSDPGPKPGDCGQGRPLRHLVPQRARTSRAAHG